MGKIDDFDKELKKLEDKYSAFFKSEENDISSIEECYIIDNETGNIRLVIRDDKNIPKSLDSEIVNAFHSVFDEQ